MAVVGKNEVHVEKSFSSPVEVVFRAVAEGKVFLNCGADLYSIKNEFKVGGGYEVHFPSHSIKNCGKYLEIIPNQKIVFTWSDEGSNMGMPASKVTMQFKPEGKGTLLILDHVGFENEGQAEDHDGGWNAGLQDFQAEIEKGIVRLLRSFDVPVEKLYAACSNPSAFFGIVADASRGQGDFRKGGRFHYPTEAGEIKGEFLEIIPNQKIVFTWESGCGSNQALNSKVTITFEAEDESSSLELVHEGLPNLESAQKHREGWNFLTNELRARLKK